MRRTLVARGQAHKRESVALPRAVNASCFRAGARLLAFASFPTSLNLPSPSGDLVPDGEETYLKAVRKTRTGV